VDGVFFATACAEHFLDDSEQLIEGTFDLLGGALSEENFDGERRLVLSRLVHLLHAGFAEGRLRRKVRGRLEGVQLVG